LSKPNVRNEPVVDSFDETSVDAEFKQKINVEYLVLKQIDRCNTAAYEGDEGKFNNAVESLLAMLPKENRQRIENDKSREQYTETIEQPVYQYSCGHPMGTPENPIYRNKKTDWNYDGGEPILVSPTIEEVEQVDYQKLYKMILSELQDVGVTWKIEPRGNVERRIKPPQTPLVRLHDGTFVRLLVEKGIEAVKDKVTVEMPVERTKEEDEEEAEDEQDLENVEDTGEPDKDWLGEGDDDSEEDENPPKEEPKKEIIKPKPVEKEKPVPKPIPSKIEEKKTEPEIIIPVDLSVPNFFSGKTDEEEKLEKIEKRKKNQAIYRERRRIQDEKDKLATN